MRKLISIVLIAIMILALVITFIYFSNRKSNNNTTMEQENQLKTTILKEGTGEMAVNDMRVTVHYTGWLVNGTKFDSSLDRGAPFEFILGASQVIEGWEKGVLGMKVGEIRRLEIPSEMGYGSQGAGIIPPNSDLIFEVELLKVSKS